MRIRVLRPITYRQGLTSAIIVAAGLSAGCSSDVARFDDGFYTGAVPQASAPSQVAANDLYGAGGTTHYPAHLDRTTTGSITPAGGQMAGANGGYGGYPAPTATAAPAGQVQSSQLPLPPGNQRTAPSDVFGATSTASAPQQGGYPANPAEMAAQANNTQRGTPPTTLQAQARHLAMPGQRPSQPTSNSPSASPQVASNSSGRTVQVESGDTLSAIARRSGVSASAIREANGLSDDTIRLGQKLVIPTGRPSGAASTSGQTSVASNAPKPYTKPESGPAAKSPQAIDERQTASVTTPEASSGKSGRPHAATAQSSPAQETRVANVAPKETVSAATKEGSGASAPAESGISRFRWPVQGRVLARYGDKVGSRRNDGLNISVPRGTPVKAAENGVVIYAGDGLKEFGNTVLVKHSDGLVTVYGHADKLNVKRGDKVQRGQEIALSGMSGDTDTPQLHFEVRKDSAPVDPSKFLN
ncbi:MAG: peptidoglycan DD-metalloendopeptidase family protein [Pseudomonadota bacterium]|nr:peptidoglycan DD-metalloendopeptidase family protein [Pseudomonadota bacterium]